MFAVAASPTPDGENALGLRLLLDGKPAAAIEHFDRALALDPSFAEARLNRGVARLNLGRNTEASADFEAIYADEKSSLRARAAYHNGLALDRLGRTHDAGVWLERALTLDPEYDDARLMLGSVREREGDLQAAGRLYLDYLKRHPDSIAAMLRLGVTAHRAGRDDVARPWLERVISASPNSPEAVEARKFLVLIE